MYSLQRTMIATRLMMMICMFVSRKKRFKTATQVIQTLFKCDTSLLILVWVTERFHNTYNPFPVKQDIHEYTRVVSRPATSTF